MSEKLPIVIVGAGAAGLSCALQLYRRNVPFLLLEQSDAVGGRLRTDLVEGFQLDRGFQILLTAYPEVRDQLDLHALKLRTFRSGALIRKPSDSTEGGFWMWSDPFREPWMLPRTLASPVGTLRDKLLVAWQAYRSLRLDERIFTVRDGETTQRYLESHGFSERFINRFVRPFLGGVFLEDRLETSSNLWLFLFRCFLLGRVALPARGMQAVAEQLAGRLPEESLRFGASVSGIDGTRVHLEGGETLDALDVVIATEGSACDRLLGRAPTRSNHATHCSYWAAPSSPLSTPMLALNPDRNSPIHNLAVPSDVAPSYAPSGQSLVAVSTQRAEAPSDEELRGALRGWFGSQVDAWRHLRTYSIPEALPAFLPGDRPRDPRVGEHLYVCGDHTAYPSLNAALGTGRRLGMRLAYR